MGRHLNTTTDAPDQPVTLPAEEALAPNDLVKITSGGYARKFIQGQAATVQNSVAGPTAVGLAAPLTSYQGATTDGGMSIRCVAVVSAATFAVAHTGNSSSSVQTANLRIFDAVSFTRLVNVQLTSSTSVQGLRLVKAGANLVAAWNDMAASNLLTCGVYDAVTGAVLAAPAGIQQLSSGVSHNWTLRDLANGDFVLVYSKVTSGDLALRRYNAAGLAQGGEVSIAPGASATAGVGVHLLAAGGFLVSWNPSAGGFRFARFNAAGAMQGSVVSVATGAQFGMLMSADDRIIELANGNIAAIDPSATGGVKLYDASANLLATVAAGTSTSNAQYGTLVKKLAGGFHFVTAGFNAHISDAGVVLASGTCGIYQPCRAFDWPGSGPVVPQVSTTAPGTGSWTAYMGGIDASLSATDASPINIATNGNYGLSGMWSEQLPNGTVVFSFWGSSSSSAQNIFHAFQPGAMSVIGVATTAAAAGGQVRVATAGRYAINQTITSPQFDRRAAMPPGTKGSLMGQQVVLEGMRA